MSRRELSAVEASLAVLEAEAAKRRAYRFHAYFPNCQPACQPSSRRPEDHVGYCRALYEPHVRFFRAGLEHRERLALGANRVGKTEMAAYEIVAHLTGLYPAWWEGFRFGAPNEWWVAGDTMQTTRDILQVSLMGPFEGVDKADWQGMIPAHLVQDVTRKSGGVPLCLDSVWVSWHGPDRKPRGKSKLQFKSYDQGRRAFQGTAVSGVWLDEEPPDEPVGSQSGEGNDIYTECLLRTMTTDGLIIATFTPLRGLTKFLEQYLQTSVMTTDEGARPSEQVFWPEGQTA
jgi:phage terminase large subunit-like protein